MKNYVIYYRVSTQKQGRSGLGLEAQQFAVDNYLKSKNHEEYSPSFTEIESGKNNNRNELRKAINLCKETNSVLLIAKLDRLSRDVAFIFTLKAELQNAGVDFIALDLPEANTLTLGIMASMAQHEREVISQRIKSALAMAKKRGVKLGNPGNLTKEARLRSYETIKRNAREDVGIRHCFHFIKPLVEMGYSYPRIAEKLNMEGYTTRKGKQFHAWQVWNIYKRFTA